jgi:tetratricopeptide (TPR) repeat protein
MEFLTLFAASLVSWALGAALMVPALVLPGGAQTAPNRAQDPSVQTATGETDGGEVSQRAQRAQAELQTGTALTRRGAFAEAIPHLVVARGQVTNEYAASFNLALCYVGTRQFSKAIEILRDLRNTGHANADVENLLAQSYVGDGQQQLAFDALRRAASLTPANEKLYLFVGDACMDRHDYEFGLKAVELGLKSLPDSARLHYQRGLFLSLLDEFDRAREDFARARQLAPGSETSFLAAANEELYAGNPEVAAKAARAGIAQGYENPVLLTILGEALIRSGVRPGEIGFTEAQIALERAVAQNPRDPGAQVSLGKIYLMADRLPEAIAHLERAKELKPDNPSVYANLATAYRRRGNATEANEALQILAKLNQAQAERISSAPGDRKATYGEQRIEKETADHKN